MRAVVGLLVLGTLFLLAATWQSRTTKRLQTKREREHGVPARNADAVPDGWSTLVVGRPSGSEPFEQPPGEASSSASSASTTVDDGTLSEQLDEPPYRPDFSYTVRSGDILGRICSQHYDTARPWIVNAVAAYNGLASPDDLREGQELLLPDVDFLQAERDQR
jgi:phage tail protein X